MSQPTEFISILTLYFYTRNINYANEIHLIFIIEDYPEMLLNGTNLILKAQSIQNQYYLSDKIKLIDNNFGNFDIDIVSVRDRELAIEEKIENIMALDIALLKFISSVPDIIEQNSFKLPGNVTTDYLLHEYLSVKERQIVTKLSKTFDKYSVKDAISIFSALPKTQTLQFIHNENMLQVQRDRYQESENEEDELDRNNILFIDYYNNFIDTCNIRSSCNLSSQLHINITIELRQVLFAMISTFSSNRMIYKQLKKIFIDDSNNIDRDNSSKFAKKQNIITDMTIDQCRMYSFDFMILVVYFMTLESNREILNREMTEKRNQLILILSRMFDHLLEYIDFKSQHENTSNIFYSELPIIENNIDQLENKPITFIIHMLQYALNFAPFISNAI